MATCYDPPELGVLASRFVHKRFHKDLLAGRHRWDLSNFGVAYEGRDTRKQNTAGRGVEILRDELVSIMTNHGFQIDQRGHDATISSTPSPEFPYTEPVHRDDVPSVPNHLTLHAYRSIVPGFVPIHRCKIINRRTKGSRKSHRVVYVVGAVGFRAVPPEWCLLDNYENRMNAELDKDYWFSDLAAAELHTYNLGQAFSFLKAFDAFETPDYAVDPGKLRKKESEGTISDADLASFVP